MIALVVLIVVSAIGIGAVAHAVKTAPYIKEREDSEFGQNVG